MNTIDNENGVALIAVLSLIMTAGMLVGVMTIISQFNTLNVAAAADLTRSRYVAEGCANRVIYLIDADRYLYNTGIRQLTETDYSEYDHDRYLPDTVDHEIDYYGTLVNFRIINGAAGLQMSQGRADASLSMLKEPLAESGGVYDKINILSTRISDYIDTDDNIGIDGMEKNDYEELEMIHLPRNASFEFREELLWIPGATDVLPLDRNGRFSSVRLANINLQVNPDIYTAGYTLLRNYGRLEESQAADVSAALARWRKERIMLSDQLDPLLIELLRQNFSWDPSNYYTVLIENASPENRPSSRLVLTYTSNGIIGPTDGIIRYLEWMNF